MIKFLQIHKHHYEAVQDILKQTIYEKNIDVAVTKEQFSSVSVEGNWLQDKRNKTAACHGELYPSKQGEKIYTKILGAHFYSCYVSPSESIDSYKNMLSPFASNEIGERPVVNAVAFNAWAVEWSSAKTTPRSQGLFATVAYLDIVLLNKGGETPYKKGIQICSFALFNKIKRRSEGHLHAGYFCQAKYSKLSFARGFSRSRKVTRVSQNGGMAFEKICQ